MKNYRHVRRLKLLLPLILILSSFGAHAEAPDSAPAPASESVTEVSNPEKWPQFWLTSGFISRHFKRDRNYNERNTGIGLEMRLNENHALNAGTYNNSLRRTSHYLQYVWTPLHLGPLHFGAAAGVIDGYPKLRQGKYAFMLAPVAAYHFKIFNQDAGVNLVYIPTIAQRVDGSIGVQFKFRFH